MLYKIMGKNIEVTPGLRAAVEDKMYGFTVIR